MKIYIASAMFSREEKQRVNKIANLFRKLGHEVYVPHELKIPDAHLMPNKDWANADKYRNEIQEKGYVILDSKDGYKIEKK